MLLVIFGGWLMVLGVVEVFVYVDGMASHHIETNTFLLQPIRRSQTELQMCH